MDTNRQLDPNEPMPPAGFAMTVPGVAWLLRRRTSTIREMLRDGRLTPAGTHLTRKLLIDIDSVSRLIGKPVTVFEFLRAEHPGSRRLRGDTPPLARARATSLPTHSEG